jgi:hypothetical protein
MDIGTSIIIGSFISLIGMIIILERNTVNWFKKENWKMQKTNIMNENRIKLRKMEKELGLTKTPIKTESSIPSGLIGELVNTYLQNQSESGGSGLQDIIGGFIENNPEIVESFVKGLTKKENTQDNQLYEPA